MYTARGVVGAVVVLLVLVQDVEVQSAITSYCTGCAYRDD